MYFNLNNMSMYPTNATSIVAALSENAEDTVSNIFEMINNHCTFEEQNYIVSSLKERLIKYREDFVERVNEDLLHDIELLDQLRKA